MEMFRSLKRRDSLELVAAAMLVIAACPAARAAMITYEFAGTITSVTDNQNNAVPGLGIGTLFTGYATFESSGWHRSVGTVYASLGGTDLFFTGPYIYGGVVIAPSGAYSIRIGGDSFGDITGSTFSPGNFGPELIDADGSAGIAEPFPPSLALNEFETNVFRISGTIIDSGKRIGALGRLTAFVLVPEPASRCLSLVAIICASWRRSAWHGLVGPTSRRQLLRRG